ncbi:MAG: RagB/SusD family nutrient uptake outer membrane protein [Tannerella sp.]|jgi:hypothetical protein|nr:RagB/SusD family nutrient uptake outer membrane protein [Tannerella sp.]
MKKIRIYQLLSYSIILLLFASCSDFLEPATDNTMTEEEVFANAQSFNGPLMEAYNALGETFDIQMDNMTDNSVARDLASMNYLCATGALRPDNNPLDNWVFNYQQIRRLNQYLSKMKFDPAAPIPTPVRFFRILNAQDSIDNVREFWRLYGEAYFLRAFFYSNLLKDYGGVSSDGNLLGVPLIGDQILEVTGDNLNLPRASYSDCVKEIINGCDTAVKYLPVQYMGADRVTGASMNGRASGISVLALKARVLLYAASPAFNPNNDAGLWEAAAVAAGEAIRAVAGGFQDLVNTPASSATEDPGNNYYFTQLQNKDWNDNGRDLFFRGNVLTGNKQFENDNYPPGMYGAALTNPSQNYVDAFPDRNGYPIDAEGTVYDPANPYANRDPRLALWVAFNGSQLGPGGYYTVESYESGIDAYDPLQKTSRTSYYLRKLLRPKTVSLIPGVTAAATPRTRIILGKPELYLNFAEAANEAWGVTADPKGFGFTAKTVLEKIHLQYGSGNQYLNSVIGNDAGLFRKYVRNNRRLTLSFEGHYYYDLRRWIPDGSPDALNVEVYGMKIVKTGNTFSYERILMEKRNFKSPFQPISYMELYNAPALKQNKGWE